MAEFKPGRRYRVFLPQALGADEFLRVTWHETDRVMVFSHWEGETCVAATPVRVTDTADLTTLLVDALGEAARNAAAKVPAHETTLLAWARAALRRRTPALNTSALVRRLRRSA